MRKHVTDRATDIRSLTDFLSNRIGQIKSACQRMDTSVEEALCQLCIQELDFTEQTVTEMPLNDLEQKAALFQDLQCKLDAAVQESQTKICHYYDEQRQKYNDHLILAQKYGFTVGESLQGPDFSQLTSLEHDEVLKLQMSLNDLYKAAANSLAADIEKLEATLSSEVDPDFKRTGIHIARNYFMRECYADALQEFLLELGDIEHVLLNSLNGLDKSILSISGVLKTNLTEVLLPTAVNMGDVSGASYYQELILKAADFYIPPSGDATLPGTMCTVAKVSELAEMMADLGSKLGEKLLELERSIQDKTPRGYNWGIDPNIRNRMVEISRNFRKPSKPVDIHDRLSLLNSGPPAITSASLSIKDYSIAHELLINYANIEYLLEDKLQEKGSVSVDDIPVKRQYSRHYLKLYCLRHPLEVFIEADTGRLTTISPAQVINQNVSRKC